MALNPPCACIQSTNYRCLWCPVPLRAQLPLCHCQLHWIIDQGETIGVGICVSCHSRSISPGVYTIEQQLSLVRSVLDRRSEFLRTTADRGVTAATSEAEVEGRFVLSSSVDERTDVSVRVLRPRGLENAHIAQRGTTDTTSVEWCLNEQDRSLDEYICDGFRRVDRAFDWDTQPPPRDDDM